MRPAPARISLIVCIILSTLVCPSFAESTEPFPFYDVIQPNVRFWTKVYTEFTTSQAIVHDARDLNIIYDVIDLKPYDSPSGRKINRRRMKLAKAKYEKILRRLASDPDTKNVECRRVAALFENGGSKEIFRMAKSRIRCQVGQSDRFKAGLIRSGAYIDQIRSIFRSYGLPEALAYLPHVESSFNIKAYSKFGAAGIWQFTRSTGKRFMKVGYVLDERRDPILATHAAASLLKENFEKLGSWPLAITAYNHGASGMERAKNAHGHYPSIFESYHGRTFKFASRNFYSEFIAAHQIASNYQSYFGDLQLDQPAQIQVVPLDGYAAFDQLCEHFGLSADTARALNPALRPPVFDGQKLVPKGYPFRLPAGFSLASIPADFFKDNQKPSLFYTVQRGDTAGKIARIHNVGLTDLILANNLDRRARIFPRQTLRIPQPGQHLPVKQPEPVAIPDPAVLLAEKADTSTSDQDATSQDAAPEVVVYPQPELASIIPTTVPDIIHMNGQDADINNDAPPSAEVVSADVRFEKIVSHNHRVVGILQVDVEETLGHYAEWAGVRTQRIRRLNGLSFGQTLHLHQKIRIPLSKTTAREFEENRYEFHKRLQEDFFAVYRVGNLQPYRVMRGDNLWSLCLEKFDIPMWLLKNCNPEVDFGDLRLHQKLLVPVIEKNTGEDADLTEKPESGDDSIPMEITRESV